MNFDPTASIIYEDQHFIVVNKPAGLVMDKQGHGESLRSIMSEHYQQDLYITFRIDQVVSGICLLARNQEATAKINKMIHNRDVDKNYVAVVRSGIASDHDTFENAIFHDKKRRKAFINPRIGKKGTLRYKRMASSDRYDLLRVEIENGRFHQIRCMLANKGMPIKGDVKYGFKRSNKGRFIHLHANSLTFKHPYTGRIVSFSAPLPSETLWQFFAKFL